MISNKGSALVQVIVIIVVAALTIGVMLLLMHFGVFTSNPENENVNVLNTEFLPLGRGGDVEIRQVDFCKKVDADFNCYTKTTTFTKGEKVYVRFLVATSSYEGHIILVRNYRIVDPEGRIIQDIDQKNAYTYQDESDQDKSIAFADKLTFLPEDPVGEYTIEMVVENPLLDKKVSLVKRVVIQG